MPETREIDRTNALLKLDRALQHAEELRALIDRYMGEDPPPLAYYNRYTSGPNSGDSRDYTMYVSINRLPPKALSPVIGDAIQNIRSALDHLAYEMAAPAARTDPQPRFPICTRRTAFEEQGLPSIQTFADDHQQLVAAVQPFHWPEPEHHPLAILKALSDHDGHRLVVPTVAASRDELVGAENVDLVFSQWKRGPLSDGDVILQFTATPREPGTALADPTTQLYLGLEQYPEAGVDLVSAIKRLHHYVRHDVLGLYFETGLLPAAPRPPGQPASRADEAGPPA